MNIVNTNTVSAEYSVHPIIAYFEKEQLDLNQCINDMDNEINDLVSKFISYYKDVKKIYLGNDYWYHTYFTLDAEYGISDLIAEIKHNHKNSLYHSSYWFLRYPFESVIYNHNFPLYDYLFLVFHYSKAPWWKVGNMCSSEYFKEERKKVLENIPRTDIVSSGKIYERTVDNQITNGLNLIYFKSLIDQGIDKVRVSYEFANKHNFFEC